MAVHAGCGARTLTQQGAYSSDVGANGMRCPVPATQLVRDACAWNAGCTSCW